MTEGVVGGVGDGVPASFTLAVTDAEGRVLGTEDVTAADDAASPPACRALVTAGVSTADGPAAVALRALDASYAGYAADEAGAALVDLRSAARRLRLTNSFVSSVGWVKPGERYPSRILLSNPTAKAVSGATVVVQAPVGTAFAHTAGPGTHSHTARTVTWRPGTVPAGQTRSLVLESRAATTRALPTIVWRDLSTRATLRSAAGSATAVSHGPKVIPPGDAYDTARYGDRPFPVVPVQYVDRAYADGHSGGDLAAVINSPKLAGLDLQPLPGDVARPALPQRHRALGRHRHRRLRLRPGLRLPEDRPDDGQHLHRRHRSATRRSRRPARRSTPSGSPTASTTCPAPPSGTARTPTARRSSAPWPAWPRSSRSTAAAARPARSSPTPSRSPTPRSTTPTTTPTRTASSTSSWPSSPAAAATAPPSSAPAPTRRATLAPYDNIWPHSSSLEYYLTDPETGLAGYTTDDQLKDLEGHKLYWADGRYQKMTTRKTPRKVFVRVGPYNLNPETALDKASVISHEYGHSLGLPDFYSLGGRETYGDWNLMATDKSQNMDAFSRQELGWVVPEVLTRGRTTVRRMPDSKQDTGTIHWRTPAGRPYTLTRGRDGIVHNARMYVAKLPGRQLLDPKKFATGDGASKKHAWFSGAGNDFGCATDGGGRNLDLSIPALSKLPAGSTVTLSLKSMFDIEWDYDYGFVLTSTDGGKNFTSHASTRATPTTVTTNANQNGCQAAYSNGITGSSASYTDPLTVQVDRATSNYPSSTFIADSFDISDLAGAKTPVLRFSYATDPGLARPGWFIDDVMVTATTPNGEKVLYRSDFERSGGPRDPFVFNGGCQPDGPAAAAPRAGST